MTRPSSLLAPLACLASFVLSCAAPPGPLAELASPPQDAFDARFTGRTLRSDYVHTGTATDEHVAVDRWRLEGAWPGSRTRLVDDTDLGKYRVQVLDRVSGAAIYSRGFCSIYGEWET